jgi:hypothetical protein
MDIDSKPFLFRRKESILHRNIDTARILHVAICIAIKNRSMHITIKNWKLQVQMSKPGQTHSTEHLVLDVKNPNPEHSTGGAYSSTSTFVQYAFLVARIHIAHSNIHIFFRHGNVTTLRALRAKRHAH